MMGDLARIRITLFIFTTKCALFLAATHSQGISTATPIGWWVGIHCMEICDVDEQAIVKGPRLTALAKAGNSNTHRCTGNINSFYLSFCCLDGDRRLRESIRGVSFVIQRWIWWSWLISGEYLLFSDRARGNLNFSEALVSSFLLATWNLNLVYSPRPVDAFPRNYHSQERSLSLHRRNDIFLLHHTIFYSLLVPLLIIQLEVSAFACTHAV